MTTRQTIDHISYAPNSEVPVTEFLTELGKLLNDARRDFGELTVSLDGLFDRRDESALDEIFIYVSGHRKHAFRRRQFAMNCLFCDFSMDSDIHNP